MSETDRPTTAARVRSWWGALDSEWRATLLGWSIVVVVALQQAL